MKKIVTLILIASLVLISGCNANTKKCHACENYHSKDAKFCPNCGVALLSVDEEFDMSNKSELQLIDYSDFGFQNNYGMTEWMEIVDYDFSNKSEAFVIGGGMVISLENGYLEERLFDSRTVFSGDRNDGELYNTERYNIVSNYVIEKQVTNYPTLEITDVEVVNNIPIIYTDEYHYPCLIPTYFIDFSRTDKYYIKEDLLS